MAVIVVIVLGCTDHGAGDFLVHELIGQAHRLHFVVHRVPDNELLVGVVHEEDAAVATVEHVPIPEDTQLRELLGGAGGWDELDVPAGIGVLKYAKHGRCSMECAKAGQEVGPADESAPAAANARDGIEMARLRREAEEGFQKEVLRQEIWQRRAGADGHGTGGDDS